MQATEESKAVRFLWAAVDLIPGVVVSALMAFGLFGFYHDVYFAEDAEINMRKEFVGVLLAITSFLMVVSYMRCVFTDPGNATATQPKVSEATIDPSRRYCYTCNIYRPERAHHCRFCRRCILKMDHHCPWVCNCVGLYNHKYFVLFAIYAWISCTTTAFGWMAWFDDLDSTYGWISLVITVSFAFMLSTFSWSHIYMVSVNMTTFELTQACYQSESLCSLKKIAHFSKSSPYYRSIFDNISSVLGENPLLWLLPVNSMNASTHKADEEAPLAHSDTEQILSNSI